MTLPANGNVTFRARGTVRSGARGKLLNTACVAVPKLDMRCDDDTDSIANGPSCEVDLVLTKVKTQPAGGIVLPGGTIAYTLRVGNRGCATATGVVLVDRTRPELIPFLPLPWGCTAGPGEVTCALGAIPGNGAVEISLSYAVPGCYTGPSPIVNSATVAANEEDREPADNFASASCPVGAATADLEIEKVVKSSVPVPAGTDVTYTLTATNHGPQPACGVVVTDFFPVGTRFRSVTGLCDLLPDPIKPDRVKCSVAELPPLPPGSAVTFALVLEVPDATPPCPGPLMNRATVTSGTPDPVAANNEVTIPVPEVGCEQDDLSITKSSSPEPVGAGKPLEYTLRVENHGTRPVVGATVKDFLPDGLTEVHWCCGASCPPPIHAPSPLGNIVATLSIPAGGSEICRISALAPLTCGATLDNTATVDLPPGLTDSNPDDNSAMTTTTVIGPPGVSAFCIGLCKVAFEGDAITYDFLLLNCGPANQADNPGDEFTDTLPAGLSLTGATATSGTTATVLNTATWNGAIPAGGAVTINVTATVNAGTAGMTLCNQATVAFDANGDGTNESIVLSDDPSEPGDADPCCFLVLGAAQIPTLSELGLTLFALLLAAIAMLRLRRRITA